MCMKELKKQLVSIGTLSTGIFLTLVGFAGLVLPIVPGVLLILIGLWMIVVVDIPSPPSP